MDTRNDIALAISAATGMDAAELLSYIEIDDIRRRRISLDEDERRFGIYY